MVMRESNDSDFMLSINPKFVSNPEIVQQYLLIEGSSPTMAVVSTPKVNNQPHRLLVQCRL